MNKRLNLLVKRHRLVVLALLLQQPSEVVELCREVRVLGAEGLLADRDGSLVERLGLVVLALSLQQTSEVVETRGEVRELGAEWLIIDRNG